MSGQVGMTVRQPLGVIGGIAPFKCSFPVGDEESCFGAGGGQRFVLKPRRKLQ